MRGGPADGTVAVPPGAGAALRRRYRTWALLLLPMLATLTLVFIVPIGCLILLSLHDMTGPAQVGDEFTLVNYVSFFTDPFHLRIVYNTFWLGAVVVACCLVIGYPVSYFLARTRSRGADCCCFWSSRRC